MKGYKFVFYYGLDRCVALIELEIPDDAIIVQPMDFITKMPQSKLRCDKVKFINVINYYRFSTNLEDDIFLTPVHNVSSLGTFRSLFDFAFMYKPGCTYVSEIDLNVYEECTKGIHFFQHPVDAINWIKRELSAVWLYERFYHCS